MKYYVRSGELEKIVTAKNQNEACIKALKLGDHLQIDPNYFYVDERGFRGGGTEPPTHATMPEFAIPTDKILRRYERENRKDVQDS